IRRFRDAGNAVILITHKLREALAVADDVTVLRRGATVLTGEAAALDESALVSALLGSEGEGATGAAVWEAPTSPPAAGVPSPRPGTRAIVASLRDAALGYGHGRQVLGETTLEVRHGEIIGVAAVEGSG